MPLFLGQKLALLVLENHKIYKFFGLKMVEFQRAKDFVFVGLWGISLLISNRLVLRIVTDLRTQTLRTLNVPGNIRI